MKYNDFRLIMCGIGIGVLLMFFLYESDIDSNDRDFKHLKELHSIMNDCN